MGKIQVSRGIKFAFVIMLLSAASLFAETSDERGGQNPDMAADFTNIVIDIPDFPEPEAETLGIEGGYFTCLAPENWSRTDNDPYYGDDETYLIVFSGPSAEGLPVSIYVSFYGAGNEDFDGQDDFLYRNTMDIFGDVIAVPEKSRVNDRDALTFGYEREQYLDLASKDETKVTVKKKFYVVTSRDGDGFFVLEYFSPKSAYDEFLPVFEELVDSFKIL